MKSNQSPNGKQVDHAAIRVNQAVGMLVHTSAFLLDRWELVAAMVAVYVLTAISLSRGPLSLLYRAILRPRGLVSTDLRVDNPEPHRFGQAVGAISAALAVYLLTSGATFAGWVVVGLLTGLTAVSFAGWCIGCFVYYLLNRLGLKGFFRHAPTDEQVPMGARPRRSA